MVVTDLAALERSRERAYSSFTAEALNSDILDIIITFLYPSIDSTEVGHR